jgi:hypothetical protein
MFIKTVITKYIYVSAIYMYICMQKGQELDDVRSEQASVLT